MWPSAKRCCPVARCMNRFAELLLHYIKHWLFTWLLDAELD